MLYVEEHVYSFVKGTMWLSCHAQVEESSHQALITVDGSDSHVEKENDG